ncbi:MAG: hypothetical protein LBV34_08430 [Nocardiopsaceae bacterium]|jgi:hypothetical protein|nr:hypothetical protein [Nocardiopsaceae bacterium]
MTQWRIRVVVPEAPAGRRALSRALAQAPGTVVHLDPPGVDVAEASGDVIVELGEDEALEDLLRTLHEVSPHVFISRVGVPEQESGQPLRIRRISPTGGVAG